MPDERIDDFSVAHDNCYISTYPSLFRARLYADPSGVMPWSDIVWSLANQCRFNGHVNRFYSVLEHQLLVRRLVSLMGGGPGVQLHALTHDSCEAMLGDCPAPFKGELGRWREHEDRTQADIVKAYGLPTTGEPLVKLADWCALFIEAAELQGPDHIKTWSMWAEYGPAAMELRDHYSIKLACYPPAPSTVCRVAYNRWYDVLVQQYAETLPC